MEDKNQKNNDELNPKEEQENKEEKNTEILKENKEEINTEILKENKDNANLIKDLTTKNLILLADMENLRKRFEEEKKLLLKYGSMDLLENLLPLLDLFEMTIQAKDISEETEKYLKGFEMIFKNISNVLESYGIKKIIAKKNEEFDHTMHSAIENQYSEEIALNHIIAVSQNGYKLHDRLIRPAFVIVSKGKKEKQEEKDISREEN